MSSEVKELVGGLRHEVERWRDLRAQLENVEGMDEKCLIDTLEGESDLKEALLFLEGEVAEREAMAEAVALRIKDLQARKGRIEGTAETLRNIILQAMDRAGIDKIQGAEATLSVTKYGPDIRIETESAIPAKFWKQPDPVLDKKALKEAVLKNGEIVGGVELSNGKIGLTIRRK